MTCPQAWGFLYRLCKDGEKKHVSPEILQEWRAGGASRNKLLATFVSKCYNPHEDHAGNRARLEAFVKLRQMSRDWSKTFKGYEWLTEQEMKEKGWSETFG